ncbi:MAG: S8 family serine peptidase, partial [Acidiferrobacterales bacterium]|nr:S8 family serine peptidase [Acidiferrobacterales bacterium]
MKLTKLLSVLSGSAVVLLFGITTAGAQSAPSYDVALAPDHLALKQSRTSDIYLVQLKGDPIIVYEGEMKGYKATKPGKGNKVNPNSAAVRKYAAYLESQQDEVIASVGGEKVYSYKFALNGFAARMSAADAEALRARDDVINVWRDEMLELQTNTSPNYIGITQAGHAWSKGVTGEDVVIGIVDSGVWPEHPSFADVPTFSKGNKGALKAYGGAPAGFSSSSCDFGNSAANPEDAAFSCNNKLLAARCYNLGFSSAPDPTNPCGGDGLFTDPLDFQSARDADSHGTHVASTAGGNYGVEAFIGGESQGLISGIAPRARISAYKVCWSNSCASSDSAAAIDQAVADGVDVINFSIGGASTFFAGADDIAFLFAADAGVFVAT